MAYCIFIIFILWVLLGIFGEKALKKIEKCKKWGNFFPIFYFTWKKHKWCHYAEFHSDFSKIEDRSPKCIQIGQRYTPPLSRFRDCNRGYSWPSINRVECPIYRHLGLIKKSLLWCMYKYKSVQFHFSNI